ncbi:hypothetical protein H1R20_g4876, partial [Candolleomyces eurysporus]
MSLDLAEDEVLLFEILASYRADTGSARPSKRPRFEEESPNALPGNYVSQFFHMLAHKGTAVDPFLWAVYNILWHKRYPEGVEPFDPFQEVSVPASFSEDSNSEGTSDPRTFKVLDLTPLKKLASRFAYPSHRWLIRQSYEELRDELLNIEKATDPDYLQFVFLLGHDGVEQKPVYFQWRDRIVWFFDEEGSDVLREDQFCLHRSMQPKDVAHWYLVDLNYSQPQCLVNAVYRTIIVIATAPATNQYRRWQKENHTMFRNWWMEPWTWEELVVGASLRGNVDMTVMRAVYTRLGGSARTCLMFGDWQRQELGKQNFAISYTANSGGRDLEALVLHHSEHRDFWDSLIATVIPGQNEDGSFDRRRATTSFASTYVASAVIRRANTEIAGRIFAYYETQCKYLPLSHAAVAVAFDGFVHRILAKGLRRAKMRALRSKDNLNAPATRGGWEFVDFSADPDANELVYETYENRFKLTPRDHLCCEFKVYPSLILDGDRRLNLFQIASNGLFGFNADCLEHIPPGQRDKIHRLIFVVPEKEFDGREGMARTKQLVAGRNQEYCALAAKIPQYLLVLTDEEIRKSI